MKSSQNHSSEVIFVEYGTWWDGNYQVVSNNPNHLKVNFFGRSSANGAEATLSNEWTDGTWHHVAGVFNNLQDYLKVYMDGTEVASVTEINSPDNVLLPLYFASREGTGKFSNHQMDEVRIWNDARTQEEIRYNMNHELTGSESNLVAYYKMNTGSGSSLTDNSTNSNDGTLNNMDNSDWVAGFEPYSGGSGTSGDPYQISKANDLIVLSHISNDWDAYFIQTADISFNTDETQVDWDGDGTVGDADDALGFSPIGNSTTKFNNNGYDGNGKTISNLFINRPSTNNIGLFGYPSFSTIENLGLIDVDITGNDDVGALFGDDDGSDISNCYSTGEISGHDGVGGLIGVFYGTISESYSSCTVNGSYYDIGGLIGNNLGSISNCYSTGVVDGYKDVGGLMGNNQGTIANCYSTGNVNGDDDVGGLVGENLDDVSQSYSTGAVTGNSGVGGLIGYHDLGTINNSFWDTETSGQSTSSGGGTGKTTSEMKKLVTHYFDQLASRPAINFHDFQNFVTTVKQSLVDNQITNGELDLARKFLLN